MASNHKLTGVIKGRRVASTTHGEGKLHIEFTDGSTMTVKTAGSSHPDATGGTVKAVRQAATTLYLDFEDGSLQEVETAEATSCVMVRDKDHTLEYAD